VLEKYPKDVRLVFKNFPLNFHNMAKKAAAAALAADDQGKFWEFHEKLFANISVLNDAKFQEIAKELKLDLERFNKRVQDHGVSELINRDVAEAQRIGVNSTPSIFVNGKPLKDRSLQGFQDMIEDELRR
jgi:protein-disulfide isomerase